VLAGGPIDVGFHGQVHAASSVLPLVLNEKLSFQH
jgi:hypothetical protein